MIDAGRGGKCTQIATLSFGNNASPRTEADIDLGRATQGRGRDAGRRRARKVRLVMIIWRRLDIVPFKVNWGGTIAGPELDPHRAGR